MYNISNHKLAGSLPSSRLAQAVEKLEVSKQFDPVLSTSTYSPIACYVLKVASRCNLNCTYCYMYNLADKSYRQQPAVMSQQVVDATITRIQEHAQRHGLKSVTLIFHGGEPLLAGQSFFRYFVDSAKTRLRPAVSPCFSMQTNATLLSTQWLALLAELGIGFGISLDGPAEINDASRVDHQGRGSYEKVLEAIQLITSVQECVNHSVSVLTVINLEADPLETYRHIRSLGLGGIDFLLPDGTYDNPPPGLTALAGDTPYADWLIPIFDQWFESADGSFGIRLFENIIGLIFGSERTTDYIGGRKGSCVVIETDGGIEPVSALKACGEGFTKVGLNVLTNQIDDLYALPLFRPYLGGVDELCDRCKQCPIVNVCGGGYLPHRYRSANGFDNPSIYCKDLVKLISHIQERTLNTLPKDMRSEMGLATLPELKDRQQCSTESLTPAPVSGSAGF